jgi:hypothetical protein
VFGESFELLYVLSFVTACKITSLHILHFSEKYKSSQQPGFLCHLMLTRAEFKPCNGAGIVHSSEMGMDTATCTARIGLFPPNNQHENCKDRAGRKKIYVLFININNTLGNRRSRKELGPTSEKTRSTRYDHT